MKIEDAHGLERKIDAILGSLSGKSVARPLKLDTTTYMGTEAKSIKEMAAGNNVSTRVASHYVVEHKDEFAPALLEDAEHELKELHHSDGSSGSCLVLTGSMEDKEALAYPGGTPAGEIHMTLAYFGDRDDVTPRQVRSIEDTCKAFAEFNHPFEVTLGGMTRFSGEEEDALVLNVDANVVHEMRQWLERELTGGHGVIIKKDHGFTPHITLGYLHHEDDMPFHRWTPRKFEFHNLEFWHGNYHAIYPLGARNTEEPESPAPTEARPESIDAIEQEGAVPMRGGDEVKARYVRTPAGVRRFKKPIGSIILASGRTLKNLKVTDSEYDNFEKVKTPKGKALYIGKYDGEKGYVVADENDDVLWEGKTEDDAFNWADKWAARPAKKRPAKTAPAKKKKPDDKPAPKTSAPKKSAPAKGVKVTDAEMTKAYKPLDKKMSEDQRDALNEYQGLSFTQINGFLRGNKRHSRYKNRVDYIDEIFKMPEAKLSKDVTTFRVLDEDAIKKFKLKPGAVVRDKAFMSTTIDEDFAKEGFTGGAPQVTLTITVPKGTPAIYMDGLESMEDMEERELLLDRGSQLRIIKIEGDQVFAEVVN